MENIILKRAGAFGDVLLTTPIAARLRREHPEAAICVLTGFPHVYLGNPNVNYVSQNVLTTRAKIIDLDLVYEVNPDIHPVDAFFIAAFGDRGNDFDKMIFYHREEIPDELDGNWQVWSKTITIHPNVSWPSRTLSRDWWGALVKAIRGLGMGYRVISLGTNIDHDLAEFGAIDTRNKLATSQQATTIARSAVFVCCASGLLAIASSTDVPIVSMHTITKWQFSIQYRHGELGWNTTPLTTPLPCYGCHDRRRAEDKVTTWSCPLKHTNCANSFELERVVSAVRNAMDHDMRREPIGK